MVSFLVIAFLCSEQGPALSLAGSLHQLTTDVQGEDNMISSEQGMRTAMWQAPRRARRHPGAVPRGQLVTNPPGAVPRGQLPANEEE